MVDLIVEYLEFGCKLKQQVVEKLQLVELNLEFELMNPDDLLDQM